MCGSKIFGMNSAFSDIVLDHYRNPRNAGQIDDANACGRAENAACGDEMHLYALIEGDVIIRASCKTFGCAPSVAAGSVVTELLSGAKLEDASALGVVQIEQALGGLPPMKRHAAQLAADAVRALMSKYDLNTIAKA